MASFGFGKGFDPNRDGGARIPVEHTLKVIAVILMCAAVIVFLFCYCLGGYNFFRQSNADNRVAPDNATSPGGEIFEMVPLNRSSSPEEEPPINISGLDPGVPTPPSPPSRGVSPNRGLCWSPPMCMVHTEPRDLALPEDVRCLFSQPSEPSLPSLPTLPTLVSARPAE